MTRLGQDNHSLPRKVRHWVRLLKKLAHRNSRPGDRQQADRQLQTSKWSRTQLRTPCLPKLGDGTSGLRTPSTSDLDWFRRFDAVRVGHQSHQTCLSLGHEPPLCYRSTAWPELLVLQTAIEIADAGCG